MVKRTDGRSLDHATLEFIRKNAVDRYRAGEPASAIMASYGFCHTTIYKWLRAAASEGDAALDAKPIPGRPPALNDQQIKELHEIIVGGDPRQMGLDFGLWTRRLVAQVVQERFGISLGQTAIGRLLHRIGIVPIKPLRRAYERDPDAIRHWRSHRLPELKRRAKQHNADIAFLDECGVRSDSVLGKTWGPRGKRTVVETSGRRQSINAVSAVTESGKFWFDVYSGSMNADRFVTVLRKMLRWRRRPLYLVVDGHPAHRSKKVKDLVAECEGMLELHFLPGYAPDLNPDEFVWNYLKTVGTSRTPLREGETLRSRVINILESIRQSPRLVRSFFKSAELAYL
jgi:transposase